VSYGQLALKRGMTSSFDLWDWFDRVQLDDERHLRAGCEVEMLATDRATPVATFVLFRCLPVKLKAPSLQAKEGTVAIEELEIAYELLTLRKPQRAEGGAAGA
jgi:phage tail-like protein